MRLVVCDFDDTLVRTGFLYEEARVQFAQVVRSAGQARGLNLTQEEIIALDDEIDSKRALKLGYGQDRNAESMIMAAEQLLEHPYFYQALSEDLKAEIWDIGHYPFTKTTPPQDGAEDFLIALSDANIPVVVLTAGEEDIQRRRLQDFPYKHLLAGARVVPKKDVMTLQDLLTDHSTKPYEAWMVGNSFRSDIAPALRCGVRAAWLKSYTWTADQEHAPELDASQVFVSDKLTEIARHIVDQYTQEAAA